jgi:hypothetical protein
VTVLKRAPFGEWTVDDHDVLAEDEVVDRIMKVTAAPKDALACGQSPGPLANARLRGDALRLHGGEQLGEPQAFREKKNPAHPPRQPCEHLHSRLGRIAVSPD